MPPSRRARYVLLAQLWQVPAADHCAALSTAPQEFERRLLAWFAKH